MATKKKKAPMKKAPMKKAPMKKKTARRKPASRRKFSVEDVESQKYHKTIREKKKGLKKYHKYPEVHKSKEYQEYEKLLNNEDNRMIRRGLKRGYYKMASKKKKKKTSRKV